MAALVRAWDRRQRLDIAPLSGERAAAALAPMSYEQRIESLRLLDPDGELHSAGDALQQLVELLPGLGPVGALGRSRPGRAALQRAYRLVARHRQALSHVVPDVEPVSRWRQ